METFFSLLKQKERKMAEKLKKAKDTVGPGVITGGADNDPAGIITFTMAGSLFGYALIWVILLCTPLVFVIQEMAGRLAIVKQKGLSSIIKEHYGNNVAIPVMSVLLVANIATIGADIAGVSAVLGLVTGINWMVFVIPFTMLIGYLVLFKEYKTIRKVLIGLTAFLVVYIISSVLSNPNWALVAQGLIPSYLPTMGFVMAAIGLIGTIISPYMLFWQASEELEDHKTVLKVRELQWDTAGGMIWSNAIAIFVLIASAATIFVAGIEVTSASQAALALQPLAGQWAYLLFSLGIIISGLLALPVLAGSTAYAVSETFGWREGLENKIFSAKGFYLVFMLSLVVGASLAFLPVNPIEFLYYTQILDGLLLPFLAGVLIVLCNNKKVMGKFTNSRIKNSIAIALVIILGSFDVLLISQLLGLL